MLPRNRRPTPPGEILRHEFLEPLGLSQNIAEQVVYMVEGESIRHRCQG